MQEHGKLVGRCAPPPMLQFLLVWRGGSERGLLPHTLQFYLDRRAEGGRPIYYVRG